ncbi:MAG: MlaD family protein [Legionellaceae bacterium]|nr:MlaD family protein [Legionellaceae bacterium]
MESKTNYTIVGLTVLILLAGLITAGLWLSVGFDQNKYSIYAVYMEEAVSGLNEDSLVKFNGVKVGSISTIELNQADPQQVKILLKIQEGTPISISTQATLISQGITGTTYLGLTATSPTTAPLIRKPGEQYPVIPYKSSFFNQLEKTIEEVSVGMKQILSKDNAENLSLALKNLQTITDVFAKNSKVLNQTLRQFPELLTEVKDSVGRFSEMSHDVAAAGKQLNVTMKAGRGAIDKISQQAIPPAVILLRRLDLIAANLEQVSVELRQNPSIIIRGSAPPKPGPGE